MFKVNNKDTRTIAFEQINADWEATFWKRSSKCL